MTPQGLSRSSEVGVRELRDHLSRYIQHVADGGELLVTLRGKQVARISPADGPGPLEELRERGLVQVPQRPRRRAAGRSRPRPRASVADLVREQRR